LRGRGGTTNKLIGDDELSIGWENQIEAWEKSKSELFSGCPRILSAELFLLEAIFSA